LSDTLKIRRFARRSTNAVMAKAQFRLRRELSRTIRPSVTPSLKAGVSGYTSYRGFSPDGTATCLRADSLRQAWSCSCYLLSIP